MRPEAIFVELYATALLAGAVGLHHLGRADRSRLTSGLQGRLGVGGNDATDNRDPVWPHTEVPRFYNSIALVAACASTLLSGVELLVRAHPASETVALIIVSVLGLVTACWLGAKIRN
jgi:hypothetical protein